MLEQSPPTPPTEASEFDGSKPGFRESTSYLSITLKSLFRKVQFLEILENRQSVGKQAESNRFLEFQTLDIPAKLSGKRPLRNDPCFRSRKLCKDCRRATSVPLTGPSFPLTGPQFPLRGPLLIVQFSFLGHNAQVQIAQIRGVPLRI